jgi:hypothetical protein
LRLRKSETAMWVAKHSLFETSRRMWYDDLPSLRPASLNNHPMRAPKVMVVQCSSISCNQCPLATITCLHQRRMWYGDRFGHAFALSRILLHPTAACVWSSAMRATNGILGLALYCRLTL